MHLMYRYDQLFGPITHLYRHGWVINSKSCLFYLTDQNEKHKTLKNINSVLVVVLIIYIIYLFICSRRLKIEIIISQRHKTFE